MKNTVFSPGSDVRVTCCGPFKGLKGTICQVNTIADDTEDLFCFYLIALEGTAIQGPIWFEYHEVEPFGFSPVQALPPQAGLTNVSMLRL